MAEFDLDLTGVFESGGGMAVAEPVAVARTEAKPEPTVAKRSSVSKKKLARQCLFVDIETVPDESRLELFGLDPVPEVRPTTPLDQLLTSAEFLSLSLDECKKKLDGINPPDEWLAEVEEDEKLAAKPRKGLFEVLESHRNKIAGIARAKEDRRKLLSVTPEFCRIIALGWAIGDEEPCSLVVGTQSNGGTITEKTLLDQFWHLVSKISPVIGFNIAGFDLPTIYVRSALLGSQPTKLIDTKPWGGEVVDLMQARYPKGDSRGLKDLARIYGLEVPAEGMDGSQVYELFQSDPQKVAEYVRSDIDVTRQLYHFMRGYFVA